MVNHFKQPITYWPSTPNGFGGFSFGIPTNVSGRIEYRDELVPSGEDIIAKAVLYLPGDTPIKNTDHVIEGTSTAPDPLTLSGPAMKVVGIMKSTDLRNMTRILKIWLV